MALIFHSGSLGLSRHPDEKYLNVWMEGKAPGR